MLLKGPRLLYLKIKSSSSLIMYWNRWARILRWLLLFPRILAGAFLNPLWFTLTQIRPWTFIPSMNAWSKILHMNLKIRKFFFLCWSNWWDLPAIVLSYMRNPSAFQNTSLISTNASVRSSIARCWNDHDLGRVFVLIETKPPIEQKKQLSCSI